MISIVVPTITGREHWLKRALTSLRRTAPKAEILLYKDRETCGDAWNEGIQEAGGEYIVLFADDIEAHAGWVRAARRAIEKGYLPCPRILNSDGTLQSCGDGDVETEDGTPSEVARVPFLPRELALAIHPVLRSQYMGDYWISWRCAQLGWPTRVVRDMLLTHHLAMEGRLDTFSSDANMFLRSIR